ncbi:MAG: hydrogenase nickel incorporation protein HypB, partial [Campylobacter sp.]|nr:hydrogenase nickel incorporation protein HypB [Campylobacter sp.]
MCDTCGCDSKNGVKITNLSGVKFHAHDHHNEHEKSVDIEQKVLNFNDELAIKNREFFKRNQILALNFVSSPGAGKTSLLVDTINRLKNEINFSVIEGDQQTLNDAKKIEATGAQAVQINTGDGCHLDADMILRACKQLDIKNKSILAIENVGNLVCPAMFDLGEHKRIVIVSVTEGEDKPLKYPNMFAGSDICVISKIDLLPYINFDINELEKNIKLVNPNIQIIKYCLSKNYEWIEYLRGKFAENFK